MSSVNDKPSIVPRQDSTTENALLEEARREALIRLLQSWREEGDEQEQIETLELLQQAAEQYPISFRETTVGV